MRHEAQNSPAARGHASDILDRTVGICRQIQMRRNFGTHVLKRNGVVLFQSLQHLRSGIILTLSMSYRHTEPLHVREPRTLTGHLKIYPTTNVATAVICNERAGQNSRCRQDLESVADADCKRIAVEKFLECTPKMSAQAIAIGPAGAGIVAIGKPAWQGDYLNFF